MKESERQLNSLLCFDMPMFGSKDMPIVDMPVWEVDKEAVLQSIQQLQWKKSGGNTTLHYIYKNLWSYYVMGLLLLGSICRSKGFPCNNFCSS
jgi:hypothetical protein